MGFTALAVTSLILGAAGTATSAVGQIKSGNAAKRAGLAQQAAAEDEAQLAEYNAAVAGLQAQDAIARGSIAEGEQRANIRQVVGSQRAGYAAGNIDVGYGSAVDTQADAAFVGEVDALTIRTNAAREAWGYQVQREDLIRRAAITRKGGAAAAAAGEAAQGASRWGAAGSIATGGASLLSAKYGFDRTRPPTSGGAAAPVYSRSGDWVGPARG